MNTYSVKKFGAIGDGMSLDTAAIQKCIDACHTDGGGQVFFPKGTYLSGTIELKDNVSMYLSADAVLMGSKNLEHYTTGQSHPLAAGRWESIVFANGARNIGIYGEGIISGQGAAFPCGAEAYNFEASEHTESTEIRTRPSLVYLKDCSYIRFRDIGLEASGQFATLFYNCTNMWFDSVRIYNRENQNTDGLHYAECKDVFISNCLFDCGDDAVVMNIGAERFTISNCNITSRWSGIRLGPFSTGIFRDIAMSNCVIRDTYGCGIKLQMVEGGLMENLSFDNIVMNNVTGPISLRLAGFLGWNGDREKSLPTGIMRNIKFNNIFATVAENAKPLLHEVPPFPGELRSCMTITGLPEHLIENVTISNAHIIFKGGGTKEEARQTNIPELADFYPEYHMFGILPTYGLYARHTKNLILDNVRLEWENPDYRSAAIFEDAQHLEISGFKAMGHKDGNAVIKVIASQNIHIVDSRPINDIKIFIEEV